MGHTYQVCFCHSSKTNIKLCSKTFHAETYVFCLEASGIFKLVKVELADLGLHKHYICLKYEKFHCLRLIKYLNPIEFLDKDPMFYVHIHERIMYEDICVISVYMRSYICKYIHGYLYAYVCVWVIVCVCQ